MPHKATDKLLKVPNWVERLDDSCLRETVTEALVARFQAVRHGAEKHASCRRVLASADRTLDTIEFGRVSGDQACLKAATALRKYATATECAHPTRRNGRRS